MRLQSPYPKVNYDFIPCQGGWDLETPTLSLPNGFVRDAQNFEVSQVKGGGYRRADGYERFDGQLAPSAATFTIVQVDAMTYPEGSGSSIQIFDPTASADGYAVWFGSNYFVLVNVTGSFGVGNVVEDIGATPRGTVVTQTTVPSAADIARFTGLAADYYRALITAVPGSGPTRGVAVLPISGSDTVFAWRDNAGGTACDIYKATSSGWTAVPFFKEVSFTAGNGTIAEGETLTQGGVTATVKRIVHEQGSFLGATASGRLIITTPSGGNFAAGAATTPSATLTLSGVQTTITIAPGGSYNIRTHNFRGQTTDKRLYGCGGVDRPFEFDGTVYVPLTIGTSNAARDLVIHREHLIFGVRNSVIGSGPGEPYKVNAAAGGFEFVLGDIVTNFLPQPGDTQNASLVITTESNVHTLYGTSSLNWNLVGQNTGVMGIYRTGARVNQSYWLDDNGVTNLRATQEFGNFNASTITNNISNYIRERRSSVVGAIVNAEKSQYRLYFTDMSALYCTIVNNRLFGLMPQQLAHTFTCLWDGVSEQNKLYAGGDDGMVYQLDIGSSFDGEDIDAYLIFNWNATKSPRIRKRYRKAAVETQGGLYAALQFGYNLGYGKSTIPQDTGRTYSVASSGVPFWDSFTWDNFYWDGNGISPTELEMRGVAENLQLVIRSGTNYIPSYTINSILVHYSLGRGLR